MSVHTTGAAIASRLAGACCRCGSEGSPAVAYRFRRQDYDVCGIEGAQLTLSRCAFSRPFALCSEALHVRVFRIGFGTEMFEAYNLQAHITNLPETLMFTWIRLNLTPIKIELSRLAKERRLPPTLSSPLRCSLPGRPCASHQSAGVQERADAYTEHLLKVLLPALHPAGWGAAPLVSKPAKAADRGERKAQGSFACRGSRELFKSSVCSFASRTRPSLHQSPLRTSTTSLRSNSSPSQSLPSVQQLGCQMRKRMPLQFFCSPSVCNCARPLGLSSGAEAGHVTAI